MLLGLASGPDHVRLPSGREFIVDSRAAEFRELAVGGWARFSASSAFSTAALLVASRSDGSSQRPSMSPASTLQSRTWNCPTTVPTDARTATVLRVVAARRFSSC